MSISTTTNRWSYSGNGVTTAFAYTNKILASSDLLVYLELISTGALTLQTETTHYTVSGVGAAAGGNVTFVTAPSALYNVVIVRRVPYTQPSTFNPRKQLSPSGIEDAYDRAAILSQQVLDLISRSVRLADGKSSPSSLNGLTGSIANKYLAFDANEQPVASDGPSSVVVSAAMTPVVQAATIAAAWDLLKQTASETVPGVAELATLAEALALDTSRIMPADKIAAWLGPILEPGGRLTLTSAAPVMTADVTAAATIYYALYKHNFVPLWNGTTWGLHQIAELSLALTSNSGHTGYQQNGKNFDLFIYNDGGTIRLCTGPAWTNDTTRADAIARKDGRWTNNASIVLRFGNASGNTVTAAANRALYVGTMRASADGQTEWTPNPAAAAGGSNNKLYLWNCYHRLRVVAVERDSTDTWSYTTASYAVLNSNNNNRISFINGLAEGWIYASASIRVQPSAAVDTRFVVAYDSTTAPPAGNEASIAIKTHAVNERATPFSAFHYKAEIGHHYVTALHQSSASGTTTWAGDAGGNDSMHIGLQIDM